MNHISHMDYASNASDTSPTTVGLTEKSAYEVYIHGR